MNFDEHIEFSPEQYGSSNLISLTRNLECKRKLKFIKESIEYVDCDIKEFHELLNSSIQKRK